MIQCERGHFYDEIRFQGCPYCSQVSSAPKSVNPPVAPLNMAIPQPSCGKTVAIEGMELEPQVRKTVAIDNFEVNDTPLHKTVAISESEMTPVADVSPLVAMPVVPQPVADTPVVPQPVAQVVPQPVAPVVPQPAAPVVPQPIATAPAAAPVSDPIPAPQQSCGTMPGYSVTGLGVSENPQPIAQEEVSYYQSSDRPYAVTGLGVKENPQPIAQEAETYYQPSDRPYAVTGLGVKENPTAIPVDSGATFPIPGGANASTVAQPVQPEAAAFAAFGFPGGPMPGMFPGGPMPGMPVQNEAAVKTDVESGTIPAVVPLEEKAADPVRPADPHATVALTESEMDYTPRSHARAFFVCIDGPMTGASFVFCENKAIIGRQKNFEISLFRDNSVSRNPHAIINYYTESLRYTVSCGDEDKKVSVNGQFINGETELKLYDVVGIGQTRLLFVPVCSEKFAW